MHIRKTGLVIPLEIWLIIFKYTNTESFNKIIQCIKDIDEITYNNLLSLISWNLVKKNVKLVSIVNLLHNFKHYRLKENYLHFKSLWLNKNNKNELLYLSSHNSAFNFKNFILKNNVIENQRDKQLFVNLTSCYSDKYYEESYKETLDFYNNNVNIGIIVKYTLF